MAAALLAVANPDLDVAALSAEDLLGEILDQHEAEYWKRADERLHLGLHPDDRRTAVAMAVLCGLSSDHDDERLVRLIPALGDASAERVAKVVRWLRDLYGLRGILEPDLLAEVLVARVILASPALISATLDAASDVQLSRALLVLSRVAGRSDTAQLPVRNALDEVSIPRWISSADGILDITVGSLLPVAPSTRRALSLMTRVSRWLSTRRSRSGRIFRCFSVTRIRRGSAGATRTPMGCCVSISRKEPTCPAIFKPSWTLSPTG